MNKDIYLGLFFGGIFMAITFAILSIFALESLAIVLYYVSFAMAISLHRFIEMLKEKEK